MIDDDLKTLDVLFGYKPPPKTPTRRDSLSQSELEDALRQAGWDEKHIPTMSAIGMAESALDREGRAKVNSYNPGIGRGGKPTVEQSIGLWQINMHPSLGRNYDRRRLASDPVYNAQVAKDIFQQQGFKAWGAYTDQRYKKFLKQNGVGPSNGGTADMAALDKLFGYGQNTGVSDTDKLFGIKSPGVLSNVDPSQLFQGNARVSGGAKPLLAPGRPLAQDDPPLKGMPSAPVPPIATLGGIEGAPDVPTVQPMTVPGGLRYGDPRTAEQRGPVVQPASVPQRPVKPTKKARYSTDVKIGEDEVGIDASGQPSSLQFTVAIPQGKGSDATRAAIVDRLYQTLADNNVLNGASREDINRIVGEQGWVRAGTNERADEYDIAQMRQGQFTVDRRFLDAVQQAKGRREQRQAETGRRLGEYSNLVEANRKTLGPDEPLSIASLRAARDMGFITPEEFAQREAEERDLAHRLRAEARSGQSTIDRGRAFGEASGAPETKAAEDAYIANIFKEYETLADYKKEQDRLREEYRYRPLAHPIEFAKNFYGAVPKAVSSLLKTADVAVNVSPLKIGANLAQGRGAFAMDETALTAVGDSINNWIEDQKNKDLKNNLYVTVLPDTLGQLGVQIAAGVVSGGATLPILIGGSMGASSQYDEARKFNATDEQKLTAALVGGLAAVPDAILFRKWFKGASEAEQTGFFQKLSQSLLARLGVKYGDDVARNVVDGTIPRIVAQTLQGALFEGAQEVTENKINNIVAALGYDPSPERKKKITSWTDEDTVSFIAGTLGGGVGGAVTSISPQGIQSIDLKLNEMLERKEIAPEEANKVRERARAIVPEPGEVRIKPLVPKKTDETKVSEPSAPVGKSEGVSETKAAAPESKVEIVEGTGVFEPPVKKEPKPMTREEVSAAVKESEAELEKAERVEEPDKPEPGVQVYRPPSKEVKLSDKDIDDLTFEKKEKVAEKPSEPKAQDVQAPEPPTHKPDEITEAETSPSYLKSLDEVRNDIRNLLLQRRADGSKLPFELESSRTKSDKFFERRLDKYVKGMSEANIRDWHSTIFDKESADDLSKSVPPTKINASGESSASLEAINRVRSEKAQGVRRVVVDTRSGNERPLFGVDAPDYKPRPYESVEWRGGNRDGQVIDQGHLARAYQRKDLDEDISKSVPSDDYRGQHQAPGPDDAPLYDVTRGGEIYPDDFYGPKGLQYYGTGDMVADQESMAVIRSVRNRPRARVTIYRAVPDGDRTVRQQLRQLREITAYYQKYSFFPMRNAIVRDLEDKYAEQGLYNERQNKILDDIYQQIEDLSATLIRPRITSGDWVTLSKTYAKDHGRAVLQGKYKLLSKTVLAKQLFTNGDSLNEFGYWERPVSDEDISKSVPSENALDTIYNKDGSINYEASNAIARRVVSGEQAIERLDPEGERGRIAGGERTLEATILLAADEARRQTASPGGGAYVASRSDAARSRQEKLLEGYAKREGIWYDWNKFFRDKHFTRGGEAFVYKQSESTVAKTVDYRHIDKSLTPLGFLDNRIALFNHIFPGTKYELMGFTKDPNGKFRFLVKQQFIDVHGVSEADVAAFMKEKGFKPTERESYSNGIYNVFDVHAKNAAKDADGRIYIIDAVPKPVYEPEAMRVVDVQASEDADITKSVEPSQDRTLIAAHNLSEGNLRFADQLGGLAMPSIAIASKDIPFTGYGDITLLASPSLVDPQMVPVTDADMYSPRYPSQRIIVKHNALKNIWADVANVYQKAYAESDPFSHYVIEAALADEGLQGLTRDRAFQAYFLTQQGVTLPKDEGDIYYVMKGRQSELETFAQKVVDDAGGEYKFFKGYTPSGNRRYGAYDLDTVVKYIKSEMKSGEGWFYGSGNIRSKAAKKYRSLQQIQKDRGRIVSDKEMEQIKDDFNARLIALAEDAAPHYKYKSDRIGYTDEFGQALAEGVQKKNVPRVMREYGFEGLDYGPINQYLNDLRSAPTEYFEAKPQRAVRLQEFAAAIAPVDASETTFRLLERQGLDVFTYERGNEESRKAAVQKAITHNTDLAFRRPEEIAALGKELKAIRRVPNEQLSTNPLIGREGMEHTEKGIISIDSIEAYEFLRRAFGGFAKNPLKAYYGVTLDRRVAKNFGDYLDTVIAEAEANEIDPQFIKEVREIYREAVEKSGRLPIFIWNDIALSEELLQRGFAELRGGARFEQVSDKAVKKLTESEAYKRAVGTKERPGILARNYAGDRPATIQEEFVAKALLGQWNEIGAGTVAEQDAARAEAVAWARDFAETNAREGLSAADILDKLAKEVAYAKETAETFKELAREARGGDRTVLEAETGSSARPEPDDRRGGEETKGDGQPESVLGIGSEAVNYKNRKHAQTLRDHGLNIEDVPYIPETERGWQKRARDIINKSVTDNGNYSAAIEAFNNPKDLSDGERTALGYDLIDHLGAEGDYAKLREIADGVVTHVGKAGAGLRAAQLVSKYDFAKGVEIASKVMAKKGKQLSDREIDKLRKKLSEYAATEEERAVAMQMLTEARAENERLAGEIAENEQALQEADKRREIDKGLITALRRQVSYWKNKKVVESRPRRTAMYRDLEAKRGAIIEKLRAAFGNDIVKMAAPSETDISFNKPDIIDEDTRQALTEYAALQVLEHKPYMEVIDGMRQMTGLPDVEIKAIHADAMDMISPRSGEKKGQNDALRIRNEHKKEARRFRDGGLDLTRLDREVLKGVDDPKTVFAALLWNRALNPRDFREQMQAEFPEMNRSEVDSVLKDVGQRRDAAKAALRRQTAEKRAEKALSDKELRKLDVARRTAQTNARRAKTSIDNYFRNLGRSIPARTADVAMEGVNILKGTAATGDVSYVFRQGLLPLLVETRAAIKGDWEGVGHGFQGDNEAVRKIAESLGYDNVADYLNEHNTTQFIEKIREHPRLQEAQAMGARFTEIGDHNIADEHFSSKLLENIPLYKRFEMAYTLPGDLQRLYIYDIWAKTIEDQNLTSNEEVLAKKYAAKVVNALTGKGDIGAILAKGGALSKLLNTAFFSPSLLVSRFQSAYYLTTGFATAPKGMRLMMAKKGLRAWAALGLIAYLLGANLDPDDEEFGKIRPRKGSPLAKVLGEDQQLNPFAGMDLPVQMMWRNAAGLFKAIQKNDSGYLTDSLEETYQQLGPNKRGEPRFFRGKLSPGASWGVDYFSGYDYIGRPYTHWNAATSRLMPMGWGQAYDALVYDRYDAMMREPVDIDRAKYRFNDNERNLANMLSVLIPNFIGIGTNQYPDMDISPAVRKAGQIRDYVTAKDKDQVRIEGGLRSLIKEKLRLQQIGESTVEVEAAIRKYSAKYQQPLRELEKQARSDTGLLSFYALEMTPSEIRRVLPLANDKEREVLEKILTKKESPVQIRRQQRRAAPSPQP